MSPTFAVNTSAPFKTFRGVNGQRINLSERSDADGNEKHQSRVIEFELRNESQSPNFWIDFLILFAIVLLWNIVAHQLFITAVTVLYTLLRCKSVLSSVRADTLLVVKSVGVQIIRKRVLSYFESSTFLPWNTVKDVFINEVITGNRVIYFLTFIVRDTSSGKDEAKLVPLFRDLKPERKCLEYMYHRSSRDSKEFNYGKELMKVIRRIIKSQPRQGQQFGTHHLLVTYNHSSWTRQDKMFAMLKFRDRTDASAFPRAFILTVKLLETIPTSNHDDEYEDELIIYKKDTNNVRWNNSDNRDSNIDANGDPQEKKQLPTITTDETSSDSSTRLTPTGPPDMRVSGSLSATNTPKKNNRVTRTNSASLFADLDDLPLLERYLLEQRGQPEKPLQQQPQPPPPSPSTHQERLNEMQETVDMPYQYLIEREIERTKKHISKNFNTPKKLTNNESTDKLFSENSNGETSSPRNRTNSTNTIDNATARSANITDLVMEGLMFTIRQDQDTITVMEQKTKLEPDEVLENSEKAETKEGGECLVNSSLLKLENLITKIERSSVVKSIPRCDEDYKSALPINGFYTVGSNFADVNQTFLNRSHNITREDRTIFNPGIRECNKSRRHTFIAPKALRQPFEKHNEEWNDFEPSQDQMNMNNVQSFHNDPVNNNNNNNDNNNTNPLGARPNVIDEPMDEGKINEHIAHKHLEKQHIEQNFEIDTGSFKSNNEKLSEDEEDIVSKALHKGNAVNDYGDCTSPNNECHETNVLIDNLNLEKSPSTHSSSESNSTLKVPRIISTEIVKYDLSSLRSSRLRRRLNSSEEGNNSTKNEDLDKESLFSMNSSSQKESQQSNEEGNNNVTVTNRRRLTARRRLHGQKNDDELTETTIEMWKFVQDMTQGVRVVLQRLDLSRISNGIGKKC